MSDIFEMVNEELKKIYRAGKLPAGVVLTGGGSKLPLITDLANQIFELPVFQGLPVNQYFPIDKLNDPEYTTALGLVIWADRNIEGGYAMPGADIFKKVGSKVKTVFKSIWPS